MKGIILAGGSGTRLSPLTKVVNKSILPVYNKPLIYYPLETLKQGGIRDILIISGPGHAGQFLDLLGDGKELGIRLSYTVQKRPLGLAHGLGLAKDFADEERVAMILGDNLFGDDMESIFKRFEAQKGGAHIFLKQVSDPERFGVVGFSRDGKCITNISEKPKKPKSNWIQTGLYLFDNRVFSDVLPHLKPSKRGELEITDVTRWYIRRGEMTHTKLKNFWIDAGTFDSLLEANNVIARRLRQKR